jgi:KDO2-lipid IV(A) lauroyltransferase
MPEMYNGNIRCSGSERDMPPSDGATDQLVVKVLDSRDLCLLPVIALIKAASWSPSPRLKQALVSAIAFVAYLLSRGKRRATRRALSKALDDNLSQADKETIVKESFRVFWSEAFSMLFSPGEEALLRRTTVRGIEHLQTALGDGRGVILWESNAFGKRSLAKRVLHQRGFSVHQVHAENHMGGFYTGDPGHTTWLRRHVAMPFFHNCTRQFTAEIIYLTRSKSLAFTRVLLKRLKQNAILCSAGDGRQGQGLVPLEFLGQTDLFATGMISLARLSGAPLLPLFCIQERDGTTTLIIEPPIHIETSGDREQNVTNSIRQWVCLLESHIRRYPGKYYCWHRLGLS